MPSTAIRTSVAAMTSAARGCTVEQRELADVVALAHPGELAVAGLHDRLTLEDHEEGVAVLAFAHEMGALGELGRLHEPGDAAQLARCALREQRHGVQRLGEFATSGHGVT